MYTAEVLLGFSPGRCRHHKSTPHSVSTSFSVLSPQDTFSSDVSVTCSQLLSHSSTDYLYDYTLPSQFFTALPILVPSSLVNISGQYLSQHSPFFSALVPLSPLFLWPNYLFAHLSDLCTACLFSVPHTLY